MTNQEYYDANKELIDSLNSGRTIIIHNGGIRMTESDIDYLEKILAESKLTDYLRITIPAFDEEVS